MITKDILLYERGDGGEMAILSNDLVLVESFLQQAYIALFGGNVEVNTLGNELTSEQRFDYWANQLIWADNSIKQFNSNTERVLGNVVLNSAGRLKILDAVELDLAYLKSMSDFNVNINILDTNKVEIKIIFTKLSNQEDKVLQLIYDNAKNEVIIQRII